MSVPPAFNHHYSLQLQISSYPELRGLTPIPPSPLSSFARREPWGYESPSGEYYGRICSVIGLYDFFSTDPVGGLEDLVVELKERLVPSRGSVGSEALSAYDNCGTVHTS
jgi:hypothetical protein